MIASGLVRQLMAKIDNVLKKLRRVCLAFMERHKESGQVRRPDLAYLIDRVHVNEHKPQIYGTQFHVVDGVRRPRPIRDSANVDKRRESMGLSTMKEYTEFMNT